jgi:hypothetical protein
MQTPRRVLNLMRMGHCAPKGTTFWWQSLVRTDADCRYEAVTTTALHSRPPLRRYACGTVASK